MFLKIVKVITVIAGVFLIGIFARIFFEGTTQQPYCAYGTEINTCFKTSEMRDRYMKGGMNIWYMPERQGNNEIGWNYNSFTYDLPVGDCSETEC